MIHAGFGAFCKEVTLTLHDDGPVGLDGVREGSRHRGVVLGELPYPSIAQEVSVRKLIAVTVASAAFATVGPAGALAAPNPSGMGPPSQSCQDIEKAGGTTPGHAASSPGSPFNESGINSVLGGIGGQHYSQSSQYDVACYQVSQH
ncbi:MAG: hypothetical protein JWO74_2453 [Solirubrobacterales bacterium]|nr:hypothetical protein [Solirubrobacterales bacterium]